MIKNILIAILSVLCSINVMAQKLTVESFIQTNDAIARTRNVVGTDGNVCAAVIVRIPSANATFNGGFILNKPTYKDGEYILDMQTGAAQMRVSVPGFNTIDVKFREYLGSTLQSKTTYMLTINMPQAGGQSLTLPTVQRSTDKAILPDWLYTQKDLCYGVSVPCSNPELAKKHALANAFMTYLLNSGKGNVRGIVKYELEEVEKKEVSNFESAEKVFIDNVACNVDREFYNNRGEYIVECNFANVSSGPCKCEISRSVKSVASNDNIEISDVTIAAVIEGVEIIVNAKYNGKGYVIEVDGTLMMNNRTLEYDECLFRADGKPNDTNLAYELSSSFGETITQILSSQPLVPYSFSCTASASEEIVSDKNGVKEESKIKGLYIATVDTVLRPLGFACDRISGGMLYFSANDDNAISRITSAKVSDSLLDDNRMIVTNSVFLAPFDYRLSMSVFKAVWKNLIAHSITYDRKPEVKDDNVHYVSSIDSDALFKCHSLIKYNSKSEHFAVNYGMNQSCKDAQIKLQVGTLLGERYEPFFKSKPVKLAVQESKRLQKEGWELFSGPLLYNLDEAISCSYMYQVIKSENDDSSRFISSSSFETSNDLCNAIFKSILNGDVYVVSRISTTTVSGNLFESYSEAIPHIPSPSYTWGFRIFRKCSDGKFEVQTVNHYDREVLNKLSQ